MTAKSVKELESRLQEGMTLDKCRKCMCMKGTLDYLQSSAISKNNPEFKKKVSQCLKEMKTEYDCLGCEPCIPWKAMEHYKK
jgi:hypothetical protein